MGHSGRWWAAAALGALAAVVAWRAGAQQQPKSISALQADEAKRFEKATGEKPVTAAAPAPSARRQARRGPPFSPFLTKGQRTPNYRIFCVQCSPVATPMPGRNGQLHPDAHQDPFLDVVAVGGGGRWWCTGTLVAPKVVLTAAHCLPASRVHFGRETRDRGGTFIVQRGMRDPAGADAALLLLASSPRVHPHLWRLPGESDPPEGPGALVGFGATDAFGHRGAGTEREAFIDIDGWGCDATRAGTLGCRPGEELVLPSEDGRDTCNGDSGGPVFEQFGYGWRLIGVTSRPVGASRVPCGDGGVYVRVDRIAPWILRTIHSMHGDQGNG